MGALLAGCGGNGAISLTVLGVGPGSGLQVPAQVDTLHVEVTTQSSTSILDKTDYPLTGLGADAYPLSLTLVSNSEVGQDVNVAISGLKSGKAVAQVSALVPIHKGQVTSVTLRLSP